MGTSQRITDLPMGVSNMGGNAWSPRKKWFCLRGGSKDFGLWVKTWGSGIKFGVKYRFKSHQHL